MKQEDYTDAQLFDALIKGCPKATLDRIQGIVDRISYDMLRNRRNQGFAEKYRKDFSQMIFEELVKLALGGSIVFYGNFSGYVYRVASHRFNNGIRKYNRHTAHLSLTEPSNMVDLAREDMLIERILDCRTLVERVLLFIETSRSIKPYVRYALLEQIHSRRPIKDIAEELNMKPNTVTQGLARARKIIWVEFGLDYQKFRLE